MEKEKRNKGLIRLVIISIILDIIILLILTHVGFRGREPLRIDEIPLVIVVLLVINIFHIFLH